MSFYLAACGGILALALGYFLPLNHPEVLAANVFFLFYTLLALSALSRLTPELLTRFGASADAPVWMIFGVALATLALSVATLFIVLNETPRAPPAQMVMTLAAIPLGWATLHLMAALHYAHVYWRPEAEPETGLRAGAETRTQTAPETGAKTAPESGPEMGPKTGPAMAPEAQSRPGADADDDAVGGLEFPGTPRPGGWDFAYFALVIGMTAQTADTNVTSTQMRKLVMLHGVAAFLFNTVIVAAAVNVAVTLGG